MATYVVQRGDSLSLIAWRFGQPANETLTLYSVNSGLIGPDPHKLEVGWRLVLPAMWPIAPQRKDRPTTTWIKAAVAALKDVGFTAQPPKLEPVVSPTPPPPLPDPPAVIGQPTVTPAPSSKGKGPLLAAGGVAAAGALAWAFWPKKKVKAQPFGALCCGKR